MIGDAPEDVAQVGLRIKAVELGRTDQAVDRGGAFAAAVGAGEEIVFASQGDSAQLALGGVIVDLDPACRASTTFSSDDIYFFRSSFFISGPTRSAL